MIHTDEMRVPIQAPGEGKCSSGRIWTYLGVAANPYVIYDYTPDRTRAGPSKWLASYYYNARTRPREQVKPQMNADKRRWDWVGVDG